MDSQARVGSVLDGRYRLDRLLGEGGMGTVYRAYHLAMERDVAVKVLRGNLAQDPTAARRFALEAKATTKVESPYAVKVFDFGITAEGEYFMVMEYLDGRTAQRELDVDGPLSVDRALHVARQALAALSAAHAVGVIHRDIKPENLLLLRAGDDPDACKVLDFGVAKLMASAAGDLAASALTKEGMVFGTPEFMSPEQACGQALDGRSDVYSLAATLFTLLTGKALFRGQAAIEILSKHVVAAPPHLVDQPGMSHLHALDQVLQRALAKRPEDRHRDAAELARDLAFLAPESPRGASMQSAPTMPTPALRGRTPDSPLGVVHASAATRAAGAPQAPPTQAPPSLAPTGSAPLAFGSPLAPPRDAPFSPGQTGYLPRLQPGDLGTQALMQVIAPRRRWLWPLAALGLLVAGAGTGGWLLLRGHAPKAPAAEAAAPSLASATPSAISATPAVPTPPPNASPADAAVAADAAPALGPTDAGVAEVAAEAEARTRRLRKHLAAAEAARRAGNFIRQLTEADFALELSPREPRARFLAADALIQSGDLTKGCKYLSRLRTAEARQRAQDAGCR